MHANPSICPNCSFDVASLAIASLAFCPRCQFPIKLLQGRYRIEAKLASGGFGVVYIAIDLDTGTQTVAKLVKRDLFDTPGAGVRFLREIEVTARLSATNDHIVRYLGHGEDEDLGHFYIMEYLEGVALDEFLDEQPLLSYPDAFHIFRQLCEAVGIAHNQGIVHRDLKPENIFLIKNDEDPLFVKVLDFGIAKIIEGSMQASLTKGVIGTPTYLSPEQCLNNTIDGRSDIYAMGVILYELLTRTLVFDFEGEAMMGILYKHMNEMPLPMRERRPDLQIPKGLDEAVLRALNKKPDDRYPSVGQFWASLQPYISLPILATQVGSSTPDNIVPKGLRRNNRSAAFMPTMDSGDNSLMKQAEEAPTEPQPPVILSRQDSTLPTGTLDRPRTTPRKGRVIRPPTPQGAMSGQMLTKESLPQPSSRALSMTLVILVLVLLGAIGWIAFHQRPNAITPPQRNQPTPKRRGPSLRDALQAGLPQVTNTEDAGSSTKELPEVDPESKPEPRPKVQPRPKARPRPRLRRRTRRRRRRRVRRLKRAGVCGRPPKGKYYVFAKLSRPRRKRAKLRFYRCAQCSFRRRKGGYCLTVPKSLTRIRLRIRVDGYQDCKHYLGTQTPKILWKLKAYDPDEDLIDSSYRCYQVTP